MNNNKSVAYLAENRLAAIAKKLQSQFPRVHIYESCTCGSCGGSSRTFPVIDCSTGVPTTTFLCALYTFGDGGADACDGGTIPLEGAVKDFGRGCFIGSLRVRLKQNLDLLEGEVMELAAKLTGLEEAALAAAEPATLQA